MQRNENNNEISNAPTTGKLLASIIDLEIPELTEEEKEAIERLNSFLPDDEDEHSELLYSAHLNDLYQTNPDAGISPERFSKFLHCLRVVELIQLWSCRSHQLPGQGQDFFAPFSVALLLNNDIYRLNQKKIETNLETLESLFSQNAKITSGKSEAYLFTLYQSIMNAQNIQNASLEALQNKIKLTTRDAGINHLDNLAKEDTLEQNAQKATLEDMQNEIKLTAGDAGINHLNKLVEEDNKTNSIKIEFPGKLLQFQNSIISDVNSKAATVKLQSYLMQFANQYTNQYKRKSHAKDIQQLIIDVNNTHNLKDSVALLEKAYLKEKAHYETGRSFLRIFNIFNVNLIGFNFTKKLAQDKNEFQYPKGLAKILNSLYQDYPELLSSNQSNAISREINQIKAIENNESPKMPEKTRSKKIN